MMCRCKYTLSRVLLALALLLVVSSVSAVNLVLVTWNVRGYPETLQAYQDWFSQQLLLLGPDLLCVQEIANDDRVSIFLDEESGFSAVAFENSQDGQDNAIFSSSEVHLEDLADPTGFQHPAQAAFLSYEGFDAAIVTVHLSWSNKNLRKLEKILLKEVVESMLRVDPDVIIAGDFNTTQHGIQTLADELGLVVMIPADQYGIGTTHAGNRYDHFLVSPDLADEEAVLCRIVMFEGVDLDSAKVVSDHLPVMLWLRTNDEFRDRP